MTACMNQAAWYDANQPSETAGCTLAALYSGATTQEQCEMVRDECLANPETPEPADCSDATAGDIGECTATVDQVSACLEARQNAFIDAVNMLDCASLDMLPAEPAACTSIFSICPSLDSSVEEGGSTTPTPAA